MDVPDTFFAIPAGSIALLEEENQKPYIEALYKLPKTLFEIAVSADTGAYIRGVVKEYNLPASVFPSISFAVLEILLGKKALSQLPVVLSAKLRISDDQARRIAEDIEQNLLLEARTSLQEYQPLKQKEAPKSQQHIFKQASQGGKNLVNLKPKPGTSLPPKPPQLPRS